MAEKRHCHRAASLRAVTSASGPTPAAQDAAAAAMIGALKFEDSSRPIAEAIAGQLGEFRRRGQIILLVAGLTLQGARRATETLFLETGHPGRRLAS